MEDQDKAKWREEHGIEKYEIYRGPKKGKGYPPDLIRLLSLFNGDRLPILSIRKPISKEQLRAKDQAKKKVIIKVKDKLEYVKGILNGRGVPETLRKQEAAEVRKELGMIDETYSGGVDEEALRQFKKEVLLIEQTFKDFFFNRQRMTQFEAKLGDGTFPETEEAVKAYVTAKKVVDGCIERVNKNLQYMHPVVSNSSQGLSLDLIVKMSDLRPKKDSSKKHLALHHFDWLSLARLMVALDPGLVHQCPSCDGVFISTRTQMKCHPGECKKDHQRGARISRKNLSLGSLPKRVKRSMENA